jgi:hypothetical protein
MQESQHEPCDQCKYAMFPPDMEIAVGQEIQTPHQEDMPYEAYEVTGVYASQVSLDGLRRELQKCDGSRHEVMYAALQTHQSRCV